MKFSVCVELYVDAEDERDAVDKVENVLHCKRVEFDLGPFEISQAEPIEDIE
jgi:Iap family predicted aminopeptidase